MAESDHEHDDECALDADLFTNAFAASLEIPPSVDLGKNTSSIEKNNLVKSNTRPLLTAYEMIVGSNITVPLHTVETLCGEWEDQEMQNEIASGPLRTIKMPDGTVYGPNGDYSLFYNIKQPTRSWDYGKLGNDRSVLDSTLYVISEGVTLNPFTPAGYSLLFVLMVSMFLFSIFVEFRQIFHFLSMCALAPSTDGQCWRYDKESGKFTIVGLTRTARATGVLCMLCRFFGGVSVMCLGLDFLYYTTVKIELIMNGLALLFIVELDNVVYHATLSFKRKKEIDSIEPIQMNRVPGVYGKIVDLAGAFIPMVSFPLMFVVALMVRASQIHVFQQYFRMTAAICLFAGPTPGGPDKRLEFMGPVAGFCDSLLGITCAPDVVPKSSATQHGYCVVTDQTTMTKPTIQMYLDDPNLFSGRFNPDGTTMSWVQWGDAAPSLYTSGRWMKGPYQDVLRKNCLQMYQLDPPNDLEVDDDVGETMDGAPFSCTRDAIFKAVFGDVERAQLVDGAYTLDAIKKVRDLRDPVVVAAVDSCRMAVTGAPSAFWLNTSRPHERTHHKNHHHQNRPVRKLGASTASFEPTVLKASPKSAETLPKYYQNHQLRTGRHTTKASQDHQNYHEVTQMRLRGADGNQPRAGGRPGDLRHHGHVLR